MKKRVWLSTLFVILTAAMLAGTALAQSSEDDGWLIGHHQDGGPFDGSSEYPFDGYSGDVPPPHENWTGQFDYYVGSDADPVNAPNFPGYIGPQNVCDVPVVLANPNDTRPCVDTAQSIVIHFTLTCDYPAGSYTPGDLVIMYSRYGSENDNLFLDGEFFAEVNPGGEFIHQDFAFDLGPLNAGEHTLEISYQTSAGGQNNGHYVDEIVFSAQNGHCGDDEMCPPGLQSVVLDFEADGYSNPLSAGYKPNGGEWSSLGVQVSHDQSSYWHPLMIFDTANPTGNDPDLGTPNETFGGPGVGAGGESGQPGENSLSHDNVLIISEDRSTSSPNDYAGGGTIYFDFDNPVFVHSVEVLDIDNDESGYVTTDAGGTVSMSVLGDNSYQNITLDTDAVNDLDVHFASSGALASVVYCVEDAPMPPQHWCLEILKMFKAPGPVWSFMVDNCGASDLVNIDLSYPGGPEVACDSTSLLSGEGMMCEATGVPASPLEVSFTSAE